jgi:3-isopropylmalate dehydrogenase
MNPAQIVVIPGDGVGPEVTAAALAVCRAAVEGSDRTFEYRQALLGGGAIDATGSALPPETLELCRQADAILLGAVGGPKWDDSDVRPERGLLSLRRELQLFANLRPVQTHPLLAHASPLKEEALAGVNIMFVRELTGGIYFGPKERSDDRASDLCVYTRPEIERVVRLACGLAADRQNKLTSVDKANVLETSRLWREVTVGLVRDEFPDMALEHVLVDAMAMHLLRRPGDFDVVVTENMFGDILTDEASMLTGSLGMLPSASVGEGTALFEPIHGSAPDIAGQGIANPYGAILSVAMMLHLSLDMPVEAGRIEVAVEAALADGQLTQDLVSGDSPSVTTDQVTTAVVEHLRAARNR